MFYQSFWGLCVVLFITTYAMAHPVSFEDSKGIMGTHSPRMNHIQLNYSYKYWFAVGVHHFDRPIGGFNRFANFLSANFLVKRWNGPSYQANIYSILGAGHSRLEQESSGAGLVKLQFDIEDRDYYFLVTYGQIATQDRNDMKEILLRAGMSPYVGKYDDIHAWLILEYRSINLVEEGFREEVTPFLRLFYKNLLFEIGQSFNGLTRFNYIIHF